MDCPLPGYQEILLKSDVWCSEPLECDWCPHIRVAGECICYLEENCYNLKPKTLTRNSQAETRNPTTPTSNPKPKTQNPKTKTQNLKPNPKI